MHSFTGTYARIYGCCYSLPLNSVNLYKFCIFVRLQKLGVYKIYNLKHWALMPE